jgi:hypothetical protein
VTHTRSAIDSLLALVAALAWGFAVFAFGARWVSPMASGLLALAVLLSASVMVLTMHLRDRRLLALSKGVCPRCGTAIVSEHRHGRWEPMRAVWEPPGTAWDCARCGYSHSESWPCPACLRPE